ncbi:MAG: ABC transporter ATP-binding protein [Candidatus Daviesbacteria bacterium]|nr:ABC transporter ATP-binding protein [Candidatus Daviesbacteria bacterium]
MEKIRITTKLKEIFIDAKKMLAIAWQMDARITVMYYGTAALGALGPAAAGLSTKYLIDYLQVSQQLGTKTIPLILIVVLMARYVVNFVQDVLYNVLYQTYCDYLFRYKLQNYLTFLFYSKMADLDMADLENFETQNLIAKTRDTVAWRVPDFLRALSYVITGLISFLAAYIILLPILWWVPFVITITVLPRLYLKTRYGDIEWSFYGSGIPEVRKLWYFQTLFSERTSLSEIRIFQAKNFLLDKYKGIQEYLLGLYEKPLNNYVWTTIAPLILETIVLLVIASLKLPEVISGSFTIGSFALVITMIDQLNIQAGNVAGYFGWVYSNKLSVDNFLEVMSLPKKIKEKENPVIFDEIKPPVIEFKNVSFSYTKTRKALDNVSFTINPGESIALVGENGAGKTTIIKLLCRFYDADSGEILINGVNIKDLSLNNWYKFLGTLFQDFVKYQFTARENIVLGDTLKEDNDLMKQSAKLAGVSDLIEKFPKGYDQYLGRQFEDGEDLSIGQWQKVAIARAFYMQAPVLIMDEPTSAIDPEAEFEIFNQLEKLYKDRTLILVSHRFSTVKNANKIMVVEAGKISESGTHTELMKLNGKYAKMFVVQAKSYES